MTAKEAKLKAADFCAYQERTQQQVRDKLYSYGLHRDEVEDVLADLITEGFVNEERFAISYAGGKFRMKKWGRLKIVQGLKMLKISDYCIRKGLQEIEEDDYVRTLATLLEKKKQTLSDSDPFVVNQKLARYAIGKGYEPDVVWPLINENEM